MPTLKLYSTNWMEPLPLGYCNAGIVVSTGEGVNDFKPGDRVVSNGAHAEYVVVPANLCARYSRKYIIRRSHICGTEQ